MACASVARNFFEDALDAAVQVPGGDVQHPHQKTRRPTNTTSPGFTTKTEYCS